MEKLARDPKSKISLQGTAVAFLVVLLFAPYFGTEVPGIRDFLSITACCAAAAWLFTFSNGIFALLTAFPVALLALYLSEWSPWISLCSLLYLPCGYGLSLVYRKKLTRAEAVGLSAIFTTGILVLCLLIPVYLSEGSLSVGAIQRHYNGFFTPLREMLKASFTITIAGVDVSYVSDANVQFYVNLIIGIFPAFLGIVSVLMGYIGSWIFKLVAGFSRHERPDAKLWRVAPLPATGIVFLLCFLVAYFGGSLPSYLWIAAESVLLFFIPEFGLAGLSSAFEIRMVDGLPRPRILRPIVLFFAMLSGFISLVAVSAVFGLYDSIRSAFPKKQKDS